MKSEANIGEEALAQGDEESLVVVLSVSCRAGTSAQLWKVPPRQLCSVHSLNCLILTTSSSRKISGWLYPVVLLGMVATW